MGLRIDEVLVLAAHRLHEGRGGGLQREVIRRQVLGDPRVVTGRQVAGEPRRGKVCRCRHVVWDAGQADLGTARGVLEGRGTGADDRQAGVSREELRGRHVANRV